MTGACSRDFRERVVAAVRAAQGIDCVLHRIEQLMRVQALRAQPRRRGLPEDDGRRLAIAALAVTFARAGGRWVGRGM